MSLRVAFALLLGGALVGCSISRDLSPGRFACEGSGPCDAGPAPIDCTSQSCVCEDGTGPCEFDCSPPNPCLPIVCEPGSVCNLTCSTSDCELECQDGASCSLDCSTGSCKATCLGGSNCSTRCTTADCDFCCDPQAGCTYADCVVSSCDTNQQCD